MTIFYTRWRLVRLTNLIYILLVILMIITAYLQSRAFFIGYFLAFWVISIIKANKKHKVRITLVAIILTTLLTIIVTTYLKRDSSSGRILIYKLSTPMLYDSFPLGIGNNRFAVEYGKRQIAYFSTNKYTQKEFLLADNIKYLYNDYLQYVIEFGLLGLIIIIICISLIILLIIRSLKKNQSYPTLLLFTCAQLVAFGCAALFTYVFYVPVFQCIVLSCIFVLVYYSRLFITNYLATIIVFIFIYIIISSYGHHLFHRRSYSYLKDAAELYKAGYFEEANAIYRDIYPTLNFDGRIVRDYVKCLMAARKYSEAERLLVLLMLNEDSYINYNLLAECYQRSNKILLAEKTYMNAINKVPNRFTTRFNLFLFYIENRNEKKAFTTGNKILTMPIKVPSNIINQIKTIVKEEMIKLDITKEN